MKSDLSDDLLVLGINTSSAQGAVGLLLGEQVLGEVALPEDRTSSETLLPAIDQLLRLSGVSLRKLGLLSVIRGPGSFTGLRIGLATAKGLAYTEGIPVMGVVSLEALAWEAGSADEAVTVILPARPGWVYTGTYRRTGAQLACLRPPGLESLDQWICSVEPTAFVIGEGAMRHRAMLKEILPQLRIEPDPGRHAPKAETVARLGRRRFWESGGQTAASLTPLYLQPSLAELRWQERYSTGHGARQR